MAFDVAEQGDLRNRRWAGSLRRSATLLEPVWPETSTFSSGPFISALPTIALFLYAVPQVDAPQLVSVDDITKAFTPRLADPSAPSLEDAVRECLIERRHDLDDDSELSSLFRSLTVCRPPLAYSLGGFELTAMDNDPGGTLMGAAAKWVNYTFTHHYLRRDSA
ncbi:hypothetical protein OG285_32905 [Streptomyces sp. NBC_01471]|uniref:hypothetical protein n=1 Tax=Streptomyces sp. NBC_01471 TaxID=2903879 RepID=UPI00324CFE76